MNFEDIREDIEDYMQGNNITYLRKSHIADFSCKHNYELEDVMSALDYASDVWKCNEKINGVKYRRYVIDAHSIEDVERITQLKHCDYCGCYNATPLKSEDGKMFCDEDCAQYEDYYFCSECGKLTRTKYNYQATHLCENCIGENMQKYDIQKCNNCGAYVRKNQLYNVDNKHFCSYCVQNMRLITRYHGSSRSWRPYRKNREKAVYFGFENEFEIKDNTPRNLIALGMKNILKENGLENFFLFEDDGSLNTGFEAITQPFSLAWLYENENKLQLMYDFMLNSHCSAEKTTTTGLHIHFSRKALTKEYSLAKIAYLINKLQYDFIKFSNRTLNNLHYTCFDGYYNRDGEYRLDDFKHYYADNYGLNDNHSNVVNRQHRNTIEIRIFKGTLNLKRIIANVELVSNLIYYVENHTDAQCENVTFKELCLFKKTKYLKEYYYKIFEPNTKLKKVVA